MYCLCVVRCQRWLAMVRSSAPTIAFLIVSKLVLVLLRILAQWLPSRCLHCPGGQLKSSAIKRRNASMAMYGFRGVHAVSCF
jgi:hypothetical protein